MERNDFGLRLGMFLRSFLVQASWNFDRLQNLGFLFLIASPLGRRYGRGTQRHGVALRRHLGLFNTHPYFAGLVAGAVAREEGERLDRGRFLEDLKGSLMSVLGSVGDGFFWAALKPLAALAALVPALFGIWWAPLVLLVLFNGPHLAVRWWGISAGLRYGCQVIRPVRDLPLARLAPFLSASVAALAGCAAGAAALRPGWALIPGGEGSSLAAAAAVFTAAAAVTARRRRPGERAA